jgi:hypothetical protein
MMFTQEASGGITVAPSGGAALNYLGGLFQVNGGALSGQINANGCSLLLAKTISVPTTVYAVGGPTVLVSNDSPQGTVLVQGGGSLSVAVLQIASGANNAGTILLQPTGTGFGGTPGSNLTEAPGYTLTNTGTIQVNPGTGVTSTITGSINNAGTIKLTGATLVVSGGGTGIVNQPGGLINAWGTLDVTQSSLTNSGTLSPNAGQPGILNLKGAYTQTASGALNIEIAGTSGTALGQLLVTGKATLDGSMNLSIINGFLPVLGDLFKVVTFASATGTIAKYNGVNLTQYNLQLSAKQNPADITLSLSTVKSTTVSLASSANPAGLGQPVTFTATVASVFSGLPTPTGNVQFLADGKPIGSPVPLVGGVATSPSIATLGVGSHTIAAQYQSDAIFGPNQNQVPYDQSISKGVATVTVSSNIPTIPPPTYGQSQIFTANVATTISGGPAPTGRVQFTVDGTPFGQSVLLVNGIASSGIVSGLSAGSHDINAQYLGDSTYEAASSDLTDQVSPAHLAIVPDNLTMNVGQPLPNLTWHFANFVNGETALTANVAGSPNLVTTATAASPKGDYPITVKDIGSLSAPNYDFPTADFGTGTLRVTVTQKPIPSVSVNSTLPTSTYGQSVSFTVTVSPTSVGTTPTGTVQFLVDGSPIGSAVTVVSGSASSIAVANLSATTHNVVANYSGDGTYSLSTGSFSQNVNKVHLAIVPDNASRAIGQPNPTLTAHYTGFVPGENAAISGITGSPSLTTPATSSSPKGTYPITVVSAGNLSATNYDFPAANFGTGTLTVTPGSVTVAVGSTASTSTYGQSVSFTVTVSPPGSAPTPTGMVQFLVDGSPLGSAVALAAGAATSTSVANLGAGTHNVVANYVVGDANYSASSGNSTQTVNKARLSIVPDNLSKNSGQPNPALTWHYTGFALNETPTIAGITGVTTPTTTAMTNSALGTYPITVASAGTLSAKNYDFPSANFGSGVLTVRDVSTSDFYGVGHDEQAVFRPSNAQWSVNPPGNSPLPNFGAPNLFDIPVPGDYDGVGHTEMAVFRPSTGAWYIAGHDPNNPIMFGGHNLLDIPVPGDYDGVGHTEMAVFRPSTGAWYIRGHDPSKPIMFGGHNLLDIPVPGDYDGVGHTEIAVFRPSTSAWYVMGHDPSKPVTFGASNLVDIPVPGDYDGVGHTEIAVFRPSKAQWYVYDAKGNHQLPNFGATNLVEIPASGPAGYLLAKKVIGGPHIQSLGNLSPAGSATSSPVVAIVPSDQDLSEMSSTGVLGTPASGKKKLQAAWLSALDQLNGQAQGRLRWL